MPEKTRLRSAAGTFVLIVEFVSKHDSCVERQESRAAPPSGDYTYRFASAVHPPDLISNAAFQMGEAGEPRFLSVAADPRVCPVWITDILVPGSHLDTFRRSPLWQLLHDPV